MKVIEWKNFLEHGLPTTDGKKSSVTIGVFDGMHRGHCALIEKIIAHNKNYTPVVVTFRNRKKRLPHHQYIQKFNDRAAMLEKLGVEILVVIDFTESFKHMPGKEFLEIILEKGNIGYFAVGKNFRCGNKLDTGLEEIKSFFLTNNIETEFFDEITENSVPISSSRISAAIEEGNLTLAEKMLGRPLV